MYYEEAEVKKYTSTNKKTGAERTSFQINIKKDSKFREPKAIGLVDVNELKKIETFIEANQVEENEVKLNELSELNLQLEQKVKELNETKKGLESEVKSLKEEKLKLQGELLTTKEDLTSEKETSKGLLATITKLTNEKAEVEKENIFLKSRNWFNRLRNKQYKKEPSSSVLPETVETDSSEV